MPLYKEEGQDEDKSSVSPVLVELNQAFEDVSSEVTFQLSLHLSSSRGTFTMKTPLAPTWKSSPSPNISSEKEYLVLLPETSLVAFAQAGRVEESQHLEQKLYDSVAATSLWLDGVEEQVFVATALLPEEETETYLCKQEVRNP